MPERSFHSLLGALGLAPRYRETLFTYPLPEVFQALRPPEYTIHFRGITPHPVLKFWVYDYCRRAVMPTSIRQRVFHLSFQFLSRLLRPPAAVTVEDDEGAERHEPSEDTLDHAPGAHIYQMLMLLA
jgi:hypothetical protein